ncbi:DUF2066 domain-containing protein [Colwellia echini]|uniref:DUF2066 domain-containing protein n=1 Tax=Colwellia echini TaxID=1982103 RepID=A0ABY3MY70_9GAMM|nr:DUF2066 domain-containing protein [Colwellia echini]TYK66171.1 DUF2066 domain-containing protein [Colwellia echini]
MFKFPFLLFLLCFLLSSVKAVALEVNDLYQVTVVVDSQSSEQRELAISSALQGVFLKIGGKESILQNNVLVKAQNRASSYVNQYRYQRVDNQLSLVVSFNEKKVNALFKQADLALWGSLRPQVLLWLIDEQGDSRTIIAYDSEAIIPTSVTDFSKQRGLPIVMPLMDFDDSVQISESDLWGYMPEQIQQASSRYFADMVIVMRVSDSTLVSDEAKKMAETQNNISCGLLCQDQVVVTPKALDWKMYTQGALYTQQYQGVDTVTLINQGLSDITELVYQSYALSANTENDFVIEVNKVASLKDDTQLFDFLANLSAVKAVTLISAQGDVRRFQLELLGSEQSFIASLKLNDKLTQQIEPTLEEVVEPIVAPLSAEPIFTEPQPFAQQQDETMVSDSTEIETTNNNEMMYKGMKVIVLGDSENVINLFEAPVADANVEEDNVKQESDVAETFASEKTYAKASIQGDFHQDLEENLDNSTETSIEEATESIELTDEMELSAEEQLNTLTVDKMADEVENKIPLTITPNILVFSWKQG